MTWSRFDDAARKHPKAAMAGNDAWGFWAASIMYANQFGTDGFVPDSALPDVLPVPVSARKARALAEKCCEARMRPDGPGLMARDDARGGYVIHGFLEWNPSKADTDAKRERDRIRKMSARNPGGRYAESGGVPAGVRKDSESHAGAGAPARDPSPAQPSPAQPQRGSPAQAHARTHETDDPETQAPEEPVQLPPGTLEGRDRCSEAFGPFGPPQRGRIGAWRGWLTEQRVRLVAAGLDPDAVSKRFRNHHRSRNTWSECWQAEAENWVERDTRRSSSQSPPSDQTTQPLRKTQPQPNSSQVNVWEGVNELPAEWK